MWYSGQLRAGASNPVVQRWQAYDSAERYQTPHVVTETQGGVGGGHGGVHARSVVQHARRAIASHARHRVRRGIRRHSVDRDRVPADAGQFRAARRAHGRPVRPRARVRSGYHRLACGLPAHRRVQRSLADRNVARPDRLRVGHDNGQRQRYTRRHLPGGDAWPRVRDADCGCPVCHAAGHVPVRGVPAVLYVAARLRDVPSDGIDCGGGRHPDDPQQQAALAGGARGRRSGGHRLDRLFPSGGHRRGARPLRQPPARGRGVVHLPGPA